MGGGAMFTPIAGSIIGGPPSDSLNNIQRTNIIGNLHSPSFSSSHLNLSVHSTGEPSYLAETSTNDLESVDLRRYRRAIGSDFDSVFGPVPTRIEVEKAISDLQRYMHGLSTSDPEFSWLQQILNRYEPTMLQTPGYKRVYDAYRLLQTDPSVQRMVASISSDKAVWDAVLKNQAVQDLGDSLDTVTTHAKSERDESSNEEPDLATLILKWILSMAKNLIGELMGKFGLLVDEVFQQKPASERTEDMEEKLRSSLLLSVLILVIVVIGRIGGV